MNKSRARTEQAQGMNKSETSGHGGRLHCVGNPPSIEHLHPADPPPKGLLVSLFARRCVKNVEVLEDHVRGILHHLSFGISWVASPCGSPEG